MASLKQELVNRLGPYVGQRAVARVRGKYNGPAGFGGLGDWVMLYTKDEDEVYTFKRLIALDRDMFLDYFEKFRNLEPLLRNFVLIKRNIDDFLSPAPDL